MGDELAAVLMLVNEGELWQFKNTEGRWDRHALVYIVKVLVQNDNPGEDFFTCLCLHDDMVEHAHMLDTHLSIRREDAKDYWRKIA